MNWHLNSGLVTANSRGRAVSIQKEAYGHVKMLGFQASPYVWLNEYGPQWRSWPAHDGGSIDQIANLLKQLRTNPHSRRLIVSAWNPAEVEAMALPPCHCLFQFYVADGRLSCQLYQRSGDIFLGVPFNIASYALLTAMVAQVAGLEPGEFIHTLGDAHLYANHFEQAREQLRRTPKPLPTLRLNPAVTDLFAFRYKDIQLENYVADATIRAPIAV